jgi:hypothetical protein
LKKLTAIFLFLVFLFNIGGYRLWFYFEQHQSDKRLDASIDKNEYDEGDLVTIKVSLSLPYQTDWKEFERVEGEINLHGKIYKYVKRKVQNGELILLCIPDHNKMQIETAKADFFKFANDLVQNNSSKKSDNSKTISFKNASSEYDQYSFSFKINSSYNIPKNFRLYKVENLVSSPHISPEQPPDNILA